MKLQASPLKQQANPPRLRGEIQVPGDKSISHRSIMLGAIAEGRTEVSGFLQGADALATLQAFRAMGVSITDPDAGRVTIEGVGLHGLSAASGPLDMGNSGTSMRLLAGLLAGQRFASTLVGDASLSKRPMRRVSAPLATMGAAISTGPDGVPPLSIEPVAKLQGIHYELPMASAQVKSCLLLAGLYADGQTTVVEPAPTRDHSERMLRGFGYELTVDGSEVSLQGGGRLQGTAVEVPGDISSAAFFMVAASIAEDAEVCLHRVGLNPTRTGVIDILKLMGADIRCENQREIGGELLADIVVKSAPLKGIDIPEDLVPLAIDEFPALFIAAAFAEGQTRLSGAEELRVKESDRIQAMVDGLQLLGVDAVGTPDGAIINGGAEDQPSAPVVQIACHHDHRIAMAFAIASVRSSAQIEVADCDNINTSYPTFFADAAALGLMIEHG